MASAGRKFNSLLNAQFRLDSDEMLDDAKKYSRSYSCGNEREQDDEEIEIDGLSKDRRTGYLSIPDSRLTEQSDEDSSEHQAEPKRRTEVRPRRRRTPSNKSESSDEKDFNDFLDNYDEYKEQGYYPNVILGKRRRNIVVPVKKHNKNCKRYDSQESNLISSIDSQSAKFDCYQPSIASTTPSIRSTDSPSEYFTADESNNENTNVASKSSLDRSKAGFGWCNFGDNSNPRDKRNPVCSTPQSKSTVNGSAPARPPSSLSQIGWRYKNQSALSPADITVNKNKSTKIDPDSEPNSREVKRSTFSKFKSRLTSVFN